MNRSWCTANWEQTRDFTHVDSVVRVLADAMGRRVTHQRSVNLGFGEPVSVKAVAGEIGRQLGRPLDVRRAAPRPGDMRDTQADPTLMLALFPDAARPVPFSDGLPP